MRLRRRLALIFVITPSVMIAVAFAVTLSSFQHAQERQLDHALLARAITALSWWPAMVSRRWRKRRSRGPGHRPR